MIWGRTVTLHRRQFPGPYRKCKDFARRRQGADGKVGERAGWVESAVKIQSDFRRTRIAFISARNAARFLLRDGSGNIDDPFSGYVDVMVVADRI